MVVHHPRYTFPLSALGSAANRAILPGIDTVNFAAPTRALRTLAATVFTRCDQEVSFAKDLALSTRSLVEARMLAMSSHASAFSPLAALFFFSCA